MSCHRLNHLYSCFKLFFSAVWTGIVADQDQTASVISIHYLHFLSSEAPLASVPAWSNCLESSLSVMSVREQKYVKHHVTNIVIGRYGGWYDTTWPWSAPHWNSFCHLQYGIVLDAGSSHTSVYIYEWPAEKDNNTGRVAQRHVCQVKGTCCT